MAVRQEAAVGVGGHGAAEPGVALGEVGRALAQLAEAHLLQIPQHRHGEAVVQAGHVDVVAGHARLGEGQVGGLADGLALLGEPRVGDRRIDVGIGRLGAAEDPDRRLTAGPGHGLGRDDDGVPAVVVDGAVQQVQRRGDHARAEHVVDGDLAAAAHDRVRVERRVVPVGNGDLGQVCPADPEVVHVALRPHGVPGRHVRPVDVVAPRAGPGRRIRPGRAAGADLVPGLAPEQDHDVGHPGADRGRGLGQAAGRDAHLQVGQRALAELLGPEHVHRGGRAVRRRVQRDDAVDVAGRQAGVVERALDRLKLQRDRGARQQRPGLLGGVDADDSGLAGREWHAFFLPGSAGDPAPERDVLAGDVLVGDLDRHSRPGCRPDPCRPGCRAPGTAGDVRSVRRGRRRRGRRRRRRRARGR